MPDPPPSEGICLALAQRSSCSADFQQPLMLRSLKRRHSRDNSYTGSTVLSFLEQAETDHHLMSAASSFISARLPMSSHTSRTQSFAVGLVRPCACPGLMLHTLCLQAHGVQRMCRSAR